MRIAPGLCPSTVHLPSMQDPVFFNCNIPGRLLSRTWCSCQGLSAIENDTPLIPLGWASCTKRTQRLMVPAPLWHRWGGMRRGLEQIPAAGRNLYHLAQVP